MSRFTKDETTLCTYASLYDTTQFGGAEAVFRLTGRSIGSIQLKIRNIAAMLDEEGIPRNLSISALTGTASGKPARRTDWAIVKPLCAITEADLQSLCRHIIEAKPK